MSIFPFLYLQLNIHPRASYLLNLHPSTLFSPPRQAPPLASLHIHLTIISPFHPHKLFTTAHPPPPLPPPPPLSLTISSKMSLPQILRVFFFCSASHMFSPALVLSSQRVSPLLYFCIFRECLPLFYPLFFQTKRRLEKRSKPAPLTRASCRIFHLYEEETEEAITCNQSKGLLACSKKRESIFKSRLLPQ